MLEFLWVRDAHEAKTGPGRDLRLPEQEIDPAASPFGIIFVPCQDEAGTVRPFPGWHYQPAYFPPPRGFHVGANSHNLTAPLCFYFPFHDPGVSRPQSQRNSQTISDIVIVTPATDTTGVLALASQCDRLSICSGPTHLMEITLDNHAAGHTEDYRPALPLILRW